MLGCRCTGGTTHPSTQFLTAQGKLIIKRPPGGGVKKLGEFRVISVRIRTKILGRFWLDF